jgi:hypothetical protein
MLVYCLELQKKFFKHLFYSIDIYLINDVMKNYKEDYSYSTTGNVQNSEDLLSKDVKVKSQRKKTQNIKTLKLLE